MKKGIVDRWGIPQVWGPLELAIGPVPGRKKKCLYIWEGKKDEFFPLAYFTSEEAADVLVALLDKVVGEKSKR